MLERYKKGFETIYESKKKVYIVVDTKRVGNIGGMNWKMIGLFGPGVIKINNKESEIE